MMMDRRKFIQLSLGAAAISSIASTCKTKKKIRGGIIGASASVGHLLKDKTFDPPSEISKMKIVIVGAGISGLAAGYFRHGNNEISSYPWGAHYIPIPNNNLKEYLSFLKECNVITGYDSNGLPVYNDFYLCFDPQERLYINGRWQEGLIPNFGVPDPDQKQIHDFLALMEQYRNSVGKDGKQAFAIPLNESSADD